MTDFDLVVIGTGSSGTAAASRCAQAGWRVAIIDELPYGGTCPLRGCDPKKVLVGAAEVTDWSNRMHGSGIAGQIAIDWPELIRFKRTFTEPVPQEREKTYRDLGIEMYHGAARFTGASTLTVLEQTLHARRIVLAVGARPRPLQLAGEELAITSTGFLDLERLPSRIAFIGGGYIAFEFAHVAVRAGAAPVILQRGPRVLPGFEPSLVDQLVEVSKSIGIEVRVNSAVSGIEKRPGGFAVRCDGAPDGSSVECDLVVHAAGRVADLDQLDLKTGGVERTNKGVAVNEYLQSRSNPSVYAVGDCADGGGLPLTPTAAYEGEVAAVNLLEGNRQTLNFAGLASIVYTIPSLGTIGLTQDEAQKRGLEFTVHEGDSTHWYSSRRVRARRSAYKIIIEKQTARVLGAHFLGDTEELINVFALAIRAQIPATLLKDVLFGYPTPSSDIDPMLESL